MDSEDFETFKYPTYNYAPVKNTGHDNLGRIILLIAFVALFAGVLFAMMFLPAYRDNCRSEHLENLKWILTIVASITSMSAAYYFKK